MEKKRVLIIEDQMLFRTIMQDMLTAEGFNVIAAKDAENAFKLIETFNIDCLITDLYMPDMDGIEFILQLRKNPKYRHIPIIMYTSETNEDVKKKALAAGTSTFLSKPSTAEKIAKEINSLLKIEKL